MGRQKKGIFPCSQASGWELQSIDSVYVWNAGDADSDAVSSDEENADEGSDAQEEIEDAEHEGDASAEVR